MSALGAIASLLASAGIEPALATPAAIAPLAEERRRARGARDLDAYAALLDSDATELAALLRLVAVPETWRTDLRHPSSGCAGSSRTGPAGRSAPSRSPARRERKRPPSPRPPCRAGCRLPRSP